MKPFSRSASFPILIASMTLSVWTALPAPAQASDGDDIAALRQELTELRAEVDALRTTERTTRAMTDKDEYSERSDLSSNANTRALARLRSLAEKEAGGPPEEEERPEAVSFQAKGLALQKLNPEISVTGDMLSSRSNQPIFENGKSDFLFRTLGIHVESYLDPYTHFKAAVPVTEGGTTLGEAYFTRYGVGRGLNLTMGKFRQQFGTVNRWHKHGLDQTDFPLPLRQIFGNGGLNQTGFSLEWTPRSRGRVAHTVTLQLTDGDNGRVFGENERHRPAALLRYKNFRDLNDSTYFEFGINSLFGKNDTWEVGGSTVEDELDTRVWAFDMALLWEPAGKMRYRKVEWRSEAYRIEKELLAPDGSGEDTIEAWGYFSYLQQRISRTTIVGLRYDYFKPDQKNWATDSFMPLVYTSDDTSQQMVTPYLTYQQSPFVRYRFEFNRLDNSHVGPDENRFTFQVIFAAGPHKHERY